MSSEKRKQKVKDLISKNKNLVDVLSDREVKKILIYRDWQGTGGKLGYEPLANKYDLTISKVRTICSKFNKGANL